MYKKIALIIILLIGVTTGCSQTTNIITSMKEEKTIQSDGIFMGVSEDEKQIIELNDNGIRVYDAQSGKDIGTEELDRKEHMFTSLFRNNGVWSPNSNFILLTNNYQEYNTGVFHHNNMSIMVYDIHNKKLIKLLDDTEKKTEDIHYSPRWLEDNSIIYGTTNKEESSIYRITIENQKSELLYSLPKTSGKIINSFLFIAKDSLLISLNHYDPAEKDEIILYNMKEDSSKEILSTTGNDIHNLREIVGNTVLVSSLIQNKPLAQWKYRLIDFNNGYENFEVTTCSFEDPNMINALLCKDGKNIIAVSCTEDNNCQFYSYNIETKTSKKIYDFEVEKSGVSMLSSIRLTPDNKLYDPTDRNFIRVFQLEK